MSKFYALSGLRIGYLVANEELASQWETHSPPWSIGSLAQLAGIEALLDETYYSAKADETMVLRLELEQHLSDLGLDVTPSCTNFLLFRVDKNFSASELVEYASREKVFLRDCQSLSPRFNDNAVRVAVKSATANRIVVDVIRKYLE
ncbi:aminotransferase class I/II-fold pyridoxal phosphate-dependent enzyme [Kamptonema cortianum]|nr:aminotransferase class I/II-fold pyridoxal phosphate-dependent enzyme [Geitlerinema splendidum]MDK3158670.1 aminotransferase class I/II-fold pyridoxal phosphate-dependent enzyme [Kamptonema cortianum]